MKIAQGNDEGKCWANDDSRTGAASLQDRNSNPLEPLRLIGQETMFVWRLGQLVVRCSRETINSSMPVTERRIEFVSNLNYFIRAVIKKTKI